MTEGDYRSLELPGDELSTVTWRKLVKDLESYRRIISRSWGPEYRIQASKALPKRTLSMICDTHFPTVTEDGTIGFDGTIEGVKADSLLDSGSSVTSMSEDLTNEL